MSVRASAVFHVAKSVVFLGRTAFAAPTLLAARYGYVDAGRPNFAATRVRVKFRRAQDPGVMFIPQ